MSLVSEVRSRLRGLFGRGRVEHEMEEELRDHLARDEAKLVAEGTPPAEARRIARARFGALDAAREGVRDERGARWLPDSWRDLRLAGRALRKRPLYTVTACLTLGLGIAAATAVYSLVSMLLLRPLAADHPERLVSLGQSSRQLGPSQSLSLVTIQDVAALSDVFEGVTAFANDEVGLRVSADAPTERWFIHEVMGNYFTFLGHQAAVGRLFTQEDEDRREPVLVLGYEEWQSRFEGDPAVVGRSVLLNGVNYTIIGVAPEGWSGLEQLVRAEAYAPLHVVASLSAWAPERLTRRGNDFLRALARLRPGKTIDDARAVLKTLAARIAPERNETPGDYAFLSEYEQRARPVIVIASFIPAIAGTFLALAVLALIIACVNVGNLVLARTMARSGELALRRALGASRMRIGREVLSESLLLAIGALVVALPLSWFVVQWFANLRFAADIPIHVDTRLDLSVLFFCAAAAMLAGLVTGVAPALRGSHSGPGAAMQDLSRRTTGSRSSRRVGRALLVGQLALSLVLVIAGGLFLSSLQSITRLDLGVNPDGVAMATVDLSLNQYTEARARQYFQRAEERIAELPGVESFGHVRDAPMGYNQNYSMLEHEDKRPIGERASLAAHRNSLTPGAMRALGMRLLDGRGFTAADDSTAPPRALVNEVLAAQMWPELKSVVGQRFRIGAGEPLEIVGVVHHITAEFPTERPVPQYFTPYAQGGGLSRTYFLRAAGDLAPVLLGLRKTLQAIDPGVAVAEVRSFHSFLHEGKAFFLYRIAAAMTLAIGMLGVIQTLVGLYGVIAFAVGQRTREFGIRMALGARRGQLIRQVMGPSSREIGLGGMLGIVGAALLMPAVGTVLAVSPRDPLVYAVCTIGLVLLALLAVYLPSRRAATAAPAEVLRSD